MQFVVVISMIFAILVALFALQNAAVITINFLWYKVNLSQAVVILGSALFGVLIMLPFDITRRIKYSMRISELNNKIKKADGEIDSLKKGEEKAEALEDLEEEIEMSKEL